MKQIETDPIFHALKKKLDEEDEKILLFGRANIDIDEAESKKDDSLKTWNRIKSKLYVLRDKYPD